MVNSLHKLFVFLTFFITLSNFSYAHKNQFTTDFNGDGNNDLLSLLSSSNQLQINFGDGAGSLTSTVLVNLNLLNLPVQIDTYDINTDNLIDVIVIDSNGSVFSLLNNGVGGFEAPATINVGLQPLETTTDLNIGDFDNDGFIDIAVTIFGLVNARVAILHGDGIGNFGTPLTIELALMSNPIQLLTEDINRNGILDFIIKGISGAAYKVLDDGLGGYENPSIALNSLPIGNIYLKDFNQDGFPDLIVLDEVLGVLSIYIGDNQGNYGISVNTNVGILPKDLVVADINLDGLRDIIVVNATSNTINVLLNDGLSGVVNASGMVIADLLGILPPLSTPVSIVEGYFNYDCVLDYGIWNEMTESFVILVNQSGPSTEDFVFCSVFENGK
ncbi:MAG: VCBS repeat-containing protein [Gammaproteobacteria bacterium]